MSVTITEQPGQLAPTQSATQPQPAPAHTGFEQDVGNQASGQPSDDPDELAVTRARAAVAEQETAAGQNPQQQPSQQQGQQPRRKTVPKERYDEMSKRTRDAESELVYLKGKIAVLEANPVPRPTPEQQAAPAAAPTLTLAQQVEQQIVAEHAKVMEASKRFDNGEISMSDFKAIELQANTIVASLRESYLVQMLRGEMPRQQTSLADQDLLVRHQQEMEAKHPWVNHLTEAELQHLAGIARAEQAALGRPIVPGNNADLIRLRTSVSELADVFGPRWYPNKQVGVPAQQQPAPGNPQPQPQPPQQQPAPRGQEGARKLELAAKHPPNLNNAGSTTGAPAAITAEQVEKMSTDEIAALPAEVRQRILLR